MKFSDYKYVRPDLKVIEKVINDSILVFNNPDASFDDVVGAISNTNNIRIEFESMSQLVGVRNAIDTTDKFYEEEMDFLNEFGPKVQELYDGYNKALIASPYLDKLKEKYGSLLFDRIKLELETFDPKIVPLLVKEGKLTTEYQKLMASVEIEFLGEKYNLSQMRKFVEDSSREKRKEADYLVARALEKISGKALEIYDELVHVRDDMAKALGYKNYIELGYKRLGRTDYNDCDVKKYRDQVYKDIVPIANKIVAKQAKRIGISDIKNYDLGYFYKTGNEVPLGTYEEKLARTKKMYEEMSSETSEFVNYMLDHELIDLVAKKGKAGGGFCTFIAKYKSPFVFANFNGTSADIGTLTHEFGHAFQVYSSRNLEVPDYYWPTLESCEIHSMSMEFLTYPWMDKFFDDVNKFKYRHLSDSITFLPYGVLVDEFQHAVYENPNMTIEERNQVWRKLEKKYLPYKVYDDPYYESGKFWIRQSHIFHTAFYYIDYTLAQNCAHQFYVKSIENYDNALKDYVALCKIGGSKSFLGLLKSAKLDNPFIDGTLKKVSSKLDLLLDSIDDSKL